MDQIANSGRLVVLTDLRILEEELAACQGHVRQWAEVLEKGVLSGVPEFAKPRAVLLRGSPLCGILGRLGLFRKHRGRAEVRRQDLEEKFKRLAAVLGLPAQQSWVELSLHFCAR